MSKSNGKCLKIGLLNINSIGGDVPTNDKIKYVRNYLSKNNTSILALTEYIQTEDNLMNHYYMNHKDFPILSHPDTKRVGLAVPGFLLDRFEILPPWFKIQEGRRTATGKEKISDKIAQILTVKLKLDDNEIMISVVYIAPDITTDNRREVFDKILEYNNASKNYIASIVSKSI